MEKNCKSCHWWFEYAEGSDAKRWKAGECRRHAPTGHSKVGLAIPYSFEGVHPAIHPATDATHFCGDWKLKGGV